MIITKKYIGIAAALLAAAIAAACVYKSFTVKQTIAGRDYKIILDAGHQA